MAKYQFVFLITLFFLVTHSKGQSITGSLNVKGDEVIESLTKGDSVLLAISPENTIVVKDQKHTSYQSKQARVNSDLYWITSSGVSPQLSIQRSPDDNLIGFDIAKNGNTYVYFSGTIKNREVLKIYESEGSKFPGEPIPVPVTGKILSSYQDTCLNIVTLEKKTATLKILAIKEAAIVSEKVIKIPFKLDSYKDSEIEFINPTAHIRLDQSFAKVKFFVHQHVISMVLDETILPYEENQNPPFKTKLFSYDLSTGKTDIKLFLEFTNSLFRSFLIDQFLFKVIDARGGDRLMVFDVISQKQLIDMVIIPEDASKTIEGFKRNGRDFKMEKDLLKSLSVIGGGSDQWSPVILVEKNKTDYIVTVGNFSNYKGVGPTGSLLNPVGLLAFALVTAVKQSREKPAYSTYTYLSGNPLTEFSFKKDLGYYKKQLDEFEISATRDFKFKGYISARTWSAGLYTFEGATQLSIVKFPR